VLQPALNDPDCAFCQIVLGVRPAHVVLDGEHSLAFLDVRPIFPGHSLLVPREHYETLVDLPGPLVGELFLDGQRLARAVQRAMEAEGTFVAMNNVVSQSVPHVHLHVVPRRRKDGLRGFFWPRQRYDGESQMAEVAERVRTAIEY
jgi:histidine triad (HIT) family protein